MRDLDTSKFKNKFSVRLYCSCGFQSPVQKTYLALNEDVFAPLCPICGNDSLMIECLRMEFKMFNRVLFARQLKNGYELRKKGALK